jgi:hypothetical protein
MRLAVYSTRPLLDAAGCVLFLGRIEKPQV